HLPLRLSPCLLSPPHLSFPLSLPVTPQPPPPSLFPYTTLFRSGASPAPHLRQEGRAGDPRPGRHGMTAPVKAIQQVQLDGLHRGHRKSTRLNSSHVSLSYAVLCLKKKKDHCTVTQVVTCISSII